MSGMREQPAIVGSVALLDGGLDILLTALTDEIRRVIGTAGSFVHSDLGIGAQWTRPVDSSVSIMRRDHRLRRRPLFYPLLYCAGHIRAVRPLAAAAMAP